VLVGGGGIGLCFLGGEVRRLLLVSTGKIDCARIGLIQCKRFSARRGREEFVERYRFRASEDVHRCGMPGGRRGGGAMGLPIAKKSYYPLQNTGFCLAPTAIKRKLRDGEQKECPTEKKKSDRRGRKGARFVRPQTFFEKLTPKDERTMSVTRKDEGRDKMGLGGRRGRFHGRVTAVPPVLRGTCKREVTISLVTQKKARADISRTPCRTCSGRSGSQVSRVGRGKVEEG